VVSEPEGRPEIRTAKGALDIPEESGLPLTPGRGAVILEAEIPSMPISPSLLAILACPLCKADVKLTADEKGLKCVSCHRVYPIKDDIPVMIIDEAAVEPGRAVKA
jgi:uncharacterized protein YbaR (Trm112 family)